jgi:hypothetical protein
MTWDEQQEAWVRAIGVYLRYARRARRSKGRIAFWRAHRRVQRRLCGQQGYVCGMHAVDRLLARVA